MKGNGDGISLPPNRGITTGDLLFRRVGYGRPDGQEDRAPQVDLFLVVRDEPDCILINSYVDIAWKFGHFHLDPGATATPCGLLDTGGCKGCYGIKIDDAGTHAVFSHPCPFLNIRHPEHGPLVNEDLVETGRSAEPGIGFGFLDHHREPGPGDLPVPGLE